MLGDGEMTGEQIRARLAELGRLYWRDGYDREQERESYRLWGMLYRLEPDAEDVKRDRARWARDARS